MSFEKSIYENNKRYYFTTKAQRKMMPRRQKFHPFIHKETPGFKPSEYQLRRRNLRPHRFTVELTPKVVKHKPKAESERFVTKFNKVRIMGVEKEARIWSMPEAEDSRKFNQKITPMCTSVFNKTFFGGNCRCSVLSENTKIN